MYVIKRDGKRAPVQFDKITARISKLCYGLSDKVQSVVVAQKVRCRRWQPSPLRLQASNALAPSRVPSADRARPAHQVCAGVYPDVTTAELDDLAAETAAYLSTGARAALPPRREAGTHQAVPHGMRLCVTRSSAPWVGRRADCPEYSLLAARISVSNLHKLTKKSFLETMRDCFEYINPKNMTKSPLISDHGDPRPSLSLAARRLPCGPFLFR